MANALFSNVPDTYFAKPYVAFKREGSSGYNAGLAVCQSINVQDTYEYAELRGPESDVPVAKGVQSRSVTAQGSYGVFDLELFGVFWGGQAVFTPGNNRTVFQSRYDDVPGLFDMRVRSDVAGAELEGFFYRCNINGHPVLNLTDHGFVLNDFSIAVNGKSLTDSAAPKLLWEVSSPGNKTTSS